MYSNLLEILETYIPEVKCCNINSNNNNSCANNNKVDNAENGTSNELLLAHESLRFSWAFYANDCTSCVAFALGLAFSVNKTHLQEDELTEQVEVQKTQKEVEQIRSMSESIPLHLMHLPLLSLQLIANFMLQISIKYMQQATQECNNDVDNTYDETLINGYDRFFTSRERLIVILASVMLAWKQLDIDADVDEWRHLFRASKSANIHNITSSNNNRISSSYKDSNEVHALSLSELCTFYYRHFPCTFVDVCSESEMTKEDVKKNSSKRHKIDACDKDASFSVVNVNTDHSTCASWLSCVRDEYVITWEEVNEMEKYILMHLGHMSISQLPRWWNVALEMTSLFYLHEREQLAKCVKVYQEFTHHEEVKKEQKETHANKELEHMHFDAQYNNNKNLHKVNEQKYKLAVYKLLLCTIKILTCLFCHSIACNVETEHYNAAEKNFHEQHITRNLTSYKMELINDMQSNVFFGAALAAYAAKVDIAYITALLDVCMQHRQSRKNVFADNCRTMPQINTRISTIVNKLDKICNVP